MTIGDEKYVSLTTFTKDGRPKPSPVWIANLGEGKVGFTTREDSWKVRRMRNTPAVVIQASDMRGRPKAGSAPIEATAEMWTGTDYESVRDRIAKKYGWQHAMIGLRNKAKALFGREVPPDCGVAITPNE